MGEHRLPHHPAPELPLRLALLRRRELPGVEDLVDHPEELTLLGSADEGVLLRYRLGEAFGLDRCSIFLVEKGGQRVRLVASYEDPSIRNYVVDLDRYPELKQAIESGETVFIPDAASDPSLKGVQGALANRRVKSITVVPITWRGGAIGAIFLRTFRDGSSFSEADVEFTQVVASLTAKALRNAHRFERLKDRRSDDPVETNQDRTRAALLSFIRRLLEEAAQREGPWSEGLLGRSSAEEIDRLVSVAMAVIAQEAATR